MPTICYGFTLSKEKDPPKPFLVGPRQVLVLDVPIGGGFVLSSRRFALGVGFCGRSNFAAVSSYHVVGSR